jgi:hypothetical protein
MSLNAEVNTKSIQKEYQHLKQAKCERYRARVNIGSKDFSFGGGFTQNHRTLPHFACFSIKTLILCILKPTDFSKFYEERFCVNSLIATDKLRGGTLVVEISKHIKTCCFLHTWTHLDLIE